MSKSHKEEARFIEMYNTLVSSFLALMIPIPKKEENWATTSSAIQSGRIWQLSLPYICLAVVPGA